jgi:membrane-bound lytic murein transglycosylase A
MRGAVVLLVVMFAGCAARPPVPPAPEVPEAQLRAVRFADLQGWDSDDHAAALGAFRTSCAALAKRASDAALGRAMWAGTVADWRPVCDAADRTEPAAARAFFEEWFVPMALTDRGAPDGLFTGYYEPLLRAARAPSSVFRVPLHGRPADLVSVDLGAFIEDLDGRRIAGRVADGRLVPYYSRAEIEAGVLDGRAQAVFWVDDPVEKFFLEIQGSGQVELPDGERLRVGYAEQNGRPYRAIGRDLVEMGELERDEVSLQSIRAWLRANPDRAQALMNRNPSYVFFRETGPVVAGVGPVGAQGVPLTAGRSIAVDRRFVPLGVPLWVETTVPSPGGEMPLRRLMVAQDTGGAIRGVVRGDVFWGEGAAAEYSAGHMRSTGRWFALVPRGLVPSA